MLVIGTLGSGVVVMNNLNFSYRKLPSFLSVTSLVCSAQVCPVCKCTVVTRVHYRSGACTLFAAAGLCCTCNGPRWEKSLGVYSHFFSSPIFLVTFLLFRPEGRHTRVSELQITYWNVGMGGGEGGGVN